MSDLAVIIVTWNNDRVIVDALSSLTADLSASSLDFVIWVVDSNSSDNTAALAREGFPDVTLVTCEENIGFARANNLAMRELRLNEDESKSDAPSAIYLLNPDTVTQKGATQTLFDALFADDGVGAVGARLTFGDGSFQHSAFMSPGLRQIWTEFFPTPGRWIEGSFNGRYPRSMYESTEPFEVDLTLGASMMVKSDVAREVGLLDESFFMYCEEVDWAWRIRQAGWRILCVPKAHVTHLGGDSSSQARPQSVLNLWKSRLLYYDKHYPRWKRWMARRLIIQGMRRKLANTSAGDSELVSAYRQLIELASS